MDQQLKGLSCLTYLEFERVFWVEWFFTISILGFFLIHTINSEQYQGCNFSWLFFAQNMLDEIINGIAGVTLKSSLCSREILQVPYRIYKCLFITIYIFSQQLNWHLEDKIETYSVHENASFLRVWIIMSSTLFPPLVSIIKSVSNNNNLERKFPKFFFVVHRLCVKICEFPNICKGGKKQNEY